MTIIQNISLDLLRKAEDTCQVYAKQGDQDARILQVRLTREGESYQIPENATVTFRCVKPDDTSVLLPVEVTDEGVSVQLSQQVLAVSGAVLADLSLTGENGEILSTVSFVIYVEPAPVGNEVASSNELLTLMQATEDCRETAEKFNKAAFRVNGDWIQGTADGEKWNDLIRVSALKGEKGDPGGADGMIVSDGILYLTEDGEIIETDHNGIQLPKAESGLAFDGGYTDEDGYMHLTQNGEELPGDVYTPIFVGVGGGSGSGYGSDLKLVCGLESRVFSILDSKESCLIGYNWSSVDSVDGAQTGSGSAVWTVNGSRVAVQRIDQGDNSFDIRPYLTGGAGNEVLLTVSDSYGNSRNMAFSITVTTFSLNWNLGETGIYNGEGVTVRMTPNGSGSKTVVLRVDGRVVYTEAVSTSGRTVSFDLGAQSHGAHLLEAWMEMEAEGTVTATTPLRHIGAWLEAGNETCIVGMLAPEIQAKQYATVPVKFFAVDPASETTQVELKEGAQSVSVLTNVGRTLQTWAYKAKEAGSKTLSVHCGAASDSVAVHVEQAEFSVSPVTSGMVFDLDPSGHTNLEENREGFGYADASGTIHPFVFSDNFDWLNGGFQLDEDGVTAFVVKRGTSVTADISLFAEEARAYGKELKLIFKSENVRNYDAELMNCMSGNVGLKVQAQQTVVGSQLETMTVPYCEGRKIEMDINIEAESEHSFAYVCLKAIPACPPVRYSGTDSWKQSEQKLLTIGSEEADVWIYRMKLYSHSLNRYEMLDNYIADCADPVEMAERYFRNEIFNDDGTLSRTKLAQKNPQLRVVHLQANKMTTGKSDEVDADVEIVYEAGGEEHHLTAQGVKFKAQGTSSLEYILAALNLDIDFSGAREWVNGLGEAVESYAMTAQSVPVDYFNIKANVASSESANNVCLADEYNTFNPYLCPAKEGDSRIRDCVEGHPCALFFTNTSDETVEVGARSVAAGETVLYFMGDMNNSKKNFAVFGQDNSLYPKQCCVEVLNNTELQCRFRSSDLSGETWDGKGNFEFRYPKVPTQEMKDAFARMQAWVSATCRDQATGTPLGETVVYDGVGYSEDSAQYRSAKFLAEFEDHFVLDQMLFHYLFTERHCMTDNRAKNLFLSYEYVPALEDYRWSVRCNYDNDTAEGCDNSGGATFGYGIEDTDIVGSSPAFNANDSTLWVNIRDLMQDQLKERYILSKSKGAWDAERILKKFRDYQAVVPEALRIEDSWNKYFIPWINKGESAYGKKNHGDKEYWREQFETYQEVYMDSKYCDNSDRGNVISMRATIENSDAGDLQIVPYSDMYINVMYGNGGTARVRAKRNVTTLIECPADSLGDTETYVFSASNLTHLGSLANLKPKQVVATTAKRLRELRVGSGDVGYQNLNMTMISLENNPMVEYLDVRGLLNLKTQLDLGKLESLEEYYSNGSGITGVTFAKGAPLRVMKLNAVESLVARGLGKLESVLIDGRNLKSLWVEDCPAIDTYSLCESATALTRGRLTNVDWTMDNASVLTRLAGLQVSGGFDGLGAIVDGFVLTGKAYCETIAQPEIDMVTSAFPELELSYGALVPSYTVTFQNVDGTVLHVQSVVSGSSAQNPVEAGLIETPVREPSVDTVYTFIGWDTALNNVTSDRVITAAYAASTRYYTVNWWSDTAESMLLDTKQVAAYDSVEFTGSEPEYTDGGIWIGWDKAAQSVQQDMQIHSIKVLPVLPSAIPAQYEYLYSNDPEDNAAYTADEFYGILHYGKAREYFSLGEKIRLVCASEQFSDTSIVMALRSFRHFKSAERENEWAGPYFGMVGVMNSNSTVNKNNTDLFPNTTIGKLLNENVYPELPIFLRKMIEKIEVLASAGSTSLEILTSQTYLTLESRAELGFDTETAPYINEVAEGADELTFSCYTDNGSRVKKRQNGEGAATVYWLRSPYAANNGYYCAVYSDGSMYSGLSGLNYGVSFGFCLRGACGEQES